MVFEGLDSFGSGYGSMMGFVNTVMNLRLQYRAANFSFLIDYQTA
jgi:hypothetical protein